MKTYKYDSKTYSDRPINLYNLVSQIRSQIADDEMCRYEKVMIDQIDLHFKANTIVTLTAKYYISDSPS